MSTIAGYSHDQLLDMLDLIPFFEHFSPYEKKRLVSFQGGFTTFGPGDEIILEGDKNTDFYIIITGTATTMKQGVAINTMEKGEVFGEMAFFANSIRNTSVIAQDSLFLFRLNQESMQRLGCEIREKIKDQCLLKMVGRINKLSERLRVAKPPI
jgi:CRP/FNR family transcriptional regulator, cyclic AMP receptor protein